MEHVAIDLGSRKSQVCVRAADGTIVLERAVPTLLIADFLAPRAPCRVILETCAEAFAVADAIHRANPAHELRIVPATLAPTLGVGARRSKSDLRDARALSNASTRVDLGSVHIKSPQARAALTLGVSRDALVRSRTLLINCVRGWGRQHLVRPKNGASTAFPDRMRAATQVAGLELPAEISSLLEVIDTLTDHERALSKKTDEQAKKHPLCKLLRTAPIGACTAVAFVATVDDISRFPFAHALEAYLGLTPGEDSSAERQRTTGITKAGSARLRWLLVQSCWSAVNRRPEDPLVRWTIALALRRGWKIAITAMARKLAGILWAMWRYNKPYDPSRAASVTPTALAPMPPRAMELDSTHC